MAFDVDNSGVDTFTGSAFADTLFQIYDMADPTIKLKFDVGGTTGTTQTIGTNQSANQLTNIPDTAGVTDTFVLANLAQTLTNKVLSGLSNTFSNIPFSAVTGTVPISQGGTGQITRQAAINALTLPIVNALYLRSNGTNAAFDSLFAADLVGTVAISQGGTGQTTANAALNALLPSQGGNANKILKTDATNASWVTPQSLMTVPVVATLTGSGTFNVTGTPLYAILDITGPGGGGAGSIGGGNGGNGSGASTFGSGPTLVSCPAGSGGTTTAGGAGGAAPTITSPAVAMKSAPGQSGGGRQITSTGGGDQAFGGNGGSSWYAGGGGMSSLQSATSAVGKGSGGAGAGTAAAGSSSSSGGGGAGAGARIMIPNPTGGYAYSIGTGGAAGTTGGISAGGAGADGEATITLYYQ